LQLAAAATQAQTAAFPQRFPARVGRRVVVVHVADIDWIEAIGDYCGLHAAGRNWCANRCRCWNASSIPRSPAHTPSAIVRVARIAELRAATNRDAVARLADGTALKVSRTYSDALRRALAS
jgi:two-component system LytT family response regulator